MNAKMQEAHNVLARKAWQALEPYNAMLYFVPEARQAFKEIGLKGYWMGYFASRSASLGAASASVVTALFYNFHPRMVQRALPDAWQYASPQTILATRTQAADAALRRLLGERITSVEVSEAAKIAREAVAGCSILGRALFASYLDIDWPEEPHLVLWHAATLLREFRGDGHIAALVVAQLDGCEAHLLQVAAGATTREHIQPARGWSNEEWEAAQQRLQKRNLLDSNDQLTATGKDAYRELEVHTDTLASSPWQHIGSEQTTRLIELVQPLSSQIIAQGAFPIPAPLSPDLINSNTQP